MAVICLAILVVWYIAAIPMNWVVTAPKIEAAGGGLSNILSFSWNEQRPVIPAPHQIIVEIVERHLHGEALGRALARVPRLGDAVVDASGLLLGTLLGIALAIAIVHSRFLSKSLMPWIIASQTIRSSPSPPWSSWCWARSLHGAGAEVADLDVSLLLPVTIGMVKGLTSPETMQLDLMRTYNASTSEVLWKLRFPASVPFLFASLKVAVAIALTGAIVGELPTGAQAGIGARLLQGPITARRCRLGGLFVGAFIAAGLVWLVGLIERSHAQRMGARP